MTVRLVALTGAESTGKTTLAERLAEHLPGALVTEASRDLLLPGEAYGLDDVIRIGREQVRREREALASTEGWVVADTDLLVIRVWLEERFDVWPDELAGYWAEQAPRAWILTTPDIPWEPDPLRVNPHDRQRLHELYRRHLVEMNADWCEAGGTVESRQTTAIAFLRTLSAR